MRAAQAEPKENSKAQNNIKTKYSLVHSSRQNPTQIYFWRITLCANIQKKQFIKRL